jgi:hypothetical protein
MILKDREMDENIPDAAIVGDHEAKAARHIEPFDNALIDSIVHLGIALKPNFPFGRDRIVFRR